MGSIDRILATAWFLFSSVFALGVGLPVAAQEDASVPDTVISVANDAASDAAMLDRIDGILAELEGFNDVTVDVTEGVVTLGGQVLDTADLDRLEALVGRVEGVVAIRSNVAQTTDVSDRLSPVIDRLMNRIEQALILSPLFLVAVLVFVAVSALGFLVASLRYPFDVMAPNAFIADIYRQVLRALFLIVGMVLALDILGATALIGAVLGAAGIVGIALGFAVRDTVENFIVSILLSLRQPFRPNDFVEIEGELGHVIRLTSRATVLLSIDGNHIRIPNATVFKSKITNYTRNAERRFQFDLGVDADASLSEALATSLDAMRSLSFVLTEPEPACWVEEVGDSNVVLRFSAWINQRDTDFLKARGEAIRIVKTALESNGFGLPEPIYRLRFDGVPPVQMAEDQADPAGKTDARVTTGIPTRSSEDRAEQDVQRDDSIDKKVIEERADGENQDLLDTHSPEE